MENKLLFCYGTLKRNKSACHLMDKAKFIRECKTTKDYSLYALTSYAVMVEEKNGSGVVGELYEVKDFTYLDQYEGTSYGLFKRKEIELEDGTWCLAYVYNRRVDGAKLIESGLYDDVFGSR